MKEIVFMGSKPIGYRTLEYLVLNASALGAKIIGVLTNDNNRFDSDLSVTDLCGKHGIRVVSSLDDYLKIDDFDILISVQYHKILKTQHLKKARGVAVNLHMAPLPEYRGCNQFSFAILNEDKEFGTTLHKMDEGIDSGDLIAELRFPIPEGCFVKELYDLTFQKSIELFSSNIRNIINGRYTLTPQSELMKARACSTHYRKEIETLKIIDLNWPKEKIEKHIRATYMPGYEPPYAMVNGKKVYMKVDGYGD